MAYQIGIIVGRRPVAETVAAFAAAGVGLTIADPARGTYAIAGPNAYGSVRIHDDADHLTWREACPFPHTIVEAHDAPAAIAAMRAIVAGRGGFLRDERGALSGTDTPEGTNPDYDLLRSLRSVDGVDRRTVADLVRLAQADPDALLAVSEALARHREAVIPSTGPTF